MPSQQTLTGRLILIVQRRWQIAKTLSNAFEGLGARTLMTRDARAALTVIDIPDLSAAVLDSGSDPICARLAQRNIPFVLYTAMQQVTGACAAAPLILKPAPPAEVVAKVEQLLR